MSATDPSTSVQERLTVPSDVRISTIKGARFRRNRIATIGMIAAFVLAAIPLLFVIGNVVVKGLPVVTAKFLVSDIPNSAAADELSSDCETLRKYDPTAECDDEAVVEKAHSQPRFVEDCVREMIRQVSETFPNLPTDAFVMAKQENLETIHRHNVVAERYGLLSELVEEMGGTGHVTRHLSMREWLGLAPA